MDQQKPYPAYTLCEIARHQSTKSLWIIIKGKGWSHNLQRLIRFHWPSVELIYHLVYDVTEFQEDHPGGADVLKDVAGGDGTEAFEYAGHSYDAVRRLDSLAVGVLTNSKVRFLIPYQVTIGPTHGSDLTFGPARRHACRTDICIPKEKEGFGY